MTVNHTDTARLGSASPPRNQRSTKRRQASMPGDAMLLCMGLFSTFLLWVPRLRQINPTGKISLSLSGNLYARVRFLLPICTRDRGCSAHPAFPAPSCLRDNETQTSGAIRREKANVYLLFEIRNRKYLWRTQAPHSPAVIARLDRATQYSREGRVQPRSRGVLDRPVKPGDDSLVVASGCVRSPYVTMHRSDVFPSCQIADVGGASARRPNQGPSSR
jgi:hypothetical protein